MRTALGSAAARNPENLALAFQEILTATVRLRANRQSAADARSFRAHIHEAIQTAVRRSRAAGYTDEEIRMATLAVVAFLDESILNSRHPLFSDWARETLQQELFKHNVAGEIFFDNLNQLLGAADSPRLADLLEVYLLCMLLGFRGRQSSGQGELKALIHAAKSRIRRIRGYSFEWSAAAALPHEPVPAAGKDPWVRRLAVAAVASAVVALLLFGGFKLSLDSGLAGLQTLAAQEHSLQ